MFYDRFKQLCERKGVSCNKAALEIGLSNATPTKWKKTGATPAGETLEKIAAYFGVSTDYLLGKTSSRIIDLFSGTEGYYAEERNKKAHAETGKRSVSDDEIKFALFGGDGEITDAMYDEVKRFAAFVKQREAEKKKE